MSRGLVQFPALGPLPTPPSASWLPVLQESQPPELGWALPLWKVLPCPQLQPIWPAATPWVWAAGGSRIGGFSLAGGCEDAQGPFQDEQSLHLHLALWALQGCLKPEMRDQLAQPGGINSDTAKLCRFSLLLFYACIYIFILLCLFIIYMVTFLFWSNDKPV